jgi:hypothetical protein
MKTKTPKELHEARVHEMRLTFSEFNALEQHGFGGRKHNGIKQPKLSRFERHLAELRHENHLMRQRTTK